MSLIGFILIIILNTFSLILTIRIILSWLVLPPSVFIYWINKMTDPIINFFKKRFPIRLGFLDLSIIIPFLLIHKSLPFEKGQKGSCMIVFSVQLIC